MTKQEQAISEVEAAQDSPISDWVPRLRTNYFFLSDREPVKWLPEQGRRFAAFYQYLVRAGVAPSKAREVATETDYSPTDEVIEAISVVVPPKKLLKDIPKANTKTPLRNLPKVEYGWFDSLPREWVIGGFTAGAVVLSAFLFRKRG